MNEMVERVARALQVVTDPLDPYDEIGEEGRLIHRNRARAAIVAMQHYYRKKYGFIVSDILPDIDGILDEPPY